MEVSLHLLIGSANSLYEINAKNFKPSNLSTKIKDLTRYMILDSAGNRNNRIFFANIDYIASKWDKTIVILRGHDSNSIFFNF